MSYRLLVVIINYKTPELVCDGLASLSSELDLSKDHVVIVDNNSGDNSLSVLAEYIGHRGYSDWVSVVPADLNGGFSYGNNKGVNFAKADYYLLLNSDAYVRPQAIEGLINTMNTDVKIGIVGPKLEWPDGLQQVSCFFNLTPINSFLMAAKTAAFTRFFALFNVKEIPIPLELHGKIAPEWLSFACVLIRDEMVSDIGLMDEGYFMYREDNDYSRRAVEAGWGLIYESNASVVHLNKGDSNRASLKRLPPYYFESRARYFS
ncbi:MAG: glycosyltransferase family 2 protein, partial [Gammaproteobacteria bacterium]